MSISERDTHYALLRLLVNSEDYSLVCDESFTQHLQSIEPPSCFRYSCYCEGSGDNNDLHHLACLPCVYRSGALNPIHPEVNRLRDPEDASRHPMYRYYNHQLNILDYGCGANYSPVTVTPHFVRRSRRYRTTGVKR